MAKEFKGEFECLEETTEKYITFLVGANRKKTKKNWEETAKIVT